MFGSHLSIAGSMVNALREAESLGMDTVQVFTKNQQQWAAKPLDPAMVAEWKFELTRLGWAGNEKVPGRTVSHASYLINLASVNDELWRKSVDLMRDEIERCETLGIGFLVHHPGSFVGWDLDSGLGRIAKAYLELMKSTGGYRAVMCLEDTAGAGSTIGGPLEQLVQLRGMIAEATGAGERVGFCLDTCHLHAQGYDLSTRAGAQVVLDRFEALGGLAHVKVLHLNDSKGVTGSHLDRHTHIGLGTICPGGPGSLAGTGFAAFLNCPAFRSIPKILETPKETNEDGTNWDTINLRRLRALLDDSKGITAGSMPVGPKKAGGVSQRKGLATRKSSSGTNPEDKKTKPRAARPLRDGKKAR